jgi:hypothetical protein
MLYHSRLKSFAIPLLALVAVLTLACCQAEAQVKPFKITGGGFAPQGLSLVPGVPSPHWAVGHATELGRYYGAGNVQLLQFTSATTADFSSFGPFVFTAANGDQLAFTYGDTSNGAAQSGKVKLTVVGFTGNNIPIVTAIFVAEFNPVPALCTGRFSKVIGGSFIMTAVTQPFVLGSTTPLAYSWSGEGWIAYGQGN